MRLPLLSRKEFQVFKIFKNVSFDPRAYSFDPVAYFPVEDKVRMGFTILDAQLVCKITGSVK